MLKGVIFDADGTLLDSMPMWKNLDFDFLRSVHVEPTLEYTQTVNKMTLTEGVTYTKNLYQLDMSEEEIMNRIQDMACSFYYNEVPLKPFVSEFLSFLAEKNVPMTVATSSQKDFIYHGLKRNHAEGFFQEIFSCADIGVNKMQPDIYHLASDFLGTKPEETWVVEDAYHALMTAKNAGYRTLAVYDLSNQSFLEETRREADLYMPDLSDPEKFLELAR